MNTVAICDAEPVAVEGLRSLLQGTGDWRVLAGATRPAGLVDSIRNLRPTVAVLDWAFGLKPLVSLLETLGTDPGGTAPVVWGIRISASDALWLLRAGARGVVRKTCALGMLLECIQAAAAGAVWVDPSLLPGPEFPADPAAPVLTGREAQILELVERSYKNKEIAGQLGIQVGTVKVHLRHIFEKTGIRGRYGLALAGVRAKRPVATLM